MNLRKAILFAVVRICVLVLGLHFLQLTLWAQSLHLHPKKNKQRLRDMLQVGHNRPRYKYEHNTKNLSNLHNRQGPNMSL